MHQGQICLSVEKVLVHEKIFHDFLRRFAARAAKLKVDGTADRTNVIGPLINDRHLETRWITLDRGGRRYPPVFLWVRPPSRAAPSS
jgi:aldehyde dehydrogenase (NAD+)